jgi:hypothetical protein
MKPKANDKKVSPSSPNLPQIVRKILIVYLILLLFWLSVSFLDGDQ